jgi:hypothetical protein
MTPRSGPLATAPSHRMRQRGRFALCDGSQARLDERTSRPRNARDYRGLCDFPNEWTKDRERSADYAHAGMDGGPNLGFGVRGDARAGWIAEDDTNDTGHEDARIRR